MPVLNSDEYVREMRKLGVNLPVSVNILGTEYTFIYTSAEYDSELKDLSGLCDFALKIIKIEQAIYFNDCRDNPERFAVIIYSVIRHEMIHAFFYECGLDSESSYATNEELIDWLALKIPQISQTMEKAGVLIRSRQKSSTS